MLVVLFYGLLALAAGWIILAVYRFFYHFRDRVLTLERDLDEIY